MIPRPAQLEEPDFDFSNVSLTSVWNAITGQHGMSDTLLAKSFFKGAFGANGGEVLLFSDHDISNDGQTWVPHHIVGQGGFGIAGLWQKINSSGNVIDETVIKQLHQYTSQTQKLREMQYKVRIEASVNRDAQRQAEDLLQAEDQQNATASPEHSILHIRNYKYNRRCNTCRFYSIYAPHSTLEDLLRRYKCWNEILPELFIWHLAYSLAKAIKALSVSPHPSSLVHSHPDFEQDDYSKKCFILHLDLKTDNILLDYAPLDDVEIDNMYKDFTGGRANPKNPIHSYPSIRLADYGLSEYAGSRNKLGDFKGGTDGFRPPEQTGFGLIGPNAFEQHHWPVHPNDRWTERANVWSVGRVLYDCTTLDYYNTVDEIMGMTAEHLFGRKPAMRQPEYLARGNHFLPEDWAPQAAGLFTPQILKLIRDCLSPRPGDRPDVDTLEKMARDGLQSTLDRLQRDSAPPYRLYYRGNEIEAMPLGRHRWEPIDFDYLGAKRLDALGTALKLPDPKWTNYLGPDERAQAAPAVIMAQAQQSHDNFQQNVKAKRDAKALIATQRARESAQRLAAANRRWQPQFVGQHPLQHAHAAPAQPFPMGPPPIAPPKQANPKPQAHPGTKGRRGPPQPGPVRKGATKIKQESSDDNAGLPKPVNMPKTRKPAAGPTARAPVRRRGVEPEVNLDNYDESDDDGDNMPLPKKKATRKLGKTPVGPAPPRPTGQPQAQALQGGPSQAPQRQPSQANQQAPQREAPIVPAQAAALPAQALLPPKQIDQQALQGEASIVPAQAAALPAQAPLPPEQGNQQAPEREAPVVPAQAAALPVQAPQPTSAEYNVMTREQMKAELIHRNVNLSKAYERKSELKRKLRDADSDGNVGRGVWKTAKSAKRSKKSKK